MLAVGLVELRVELQVMEDLFKETKNVLYYKPEFHVCRSRVTYRNIMLRKEILSSKLSLTM